MKEDLRGALLRFAVYSVVGLLGFVVVIAVFGDLRFEKVKTYKAEFANVSALKGGNFVRLAGVEVGKVKNISILPNSTALVEFAANDSVVLTEGSRAVVRYENLLGDRYLALEEGVGGVKRLQPGATIPLSRTEPALDLDALLGGLRPVFRALDPNQVNELTGALIAAFQGQGATLNSVLAQAAVLTNTLADRDRLIGQVVVNLNTVLASLGDQGDQVAKAVDSLSQLVAGLAARKEDVTNGVAYLNAVAGSVADLLIQARPPLKKVVGEADRTAGTVMADKDFFDNLLNTLPESYQLLNRQGLYGDFFSFYLCDIVLKLPGKNGQPAYVKLAGQDTGRCAPR
jgi:phospholipid/cholesterol/gamma-HCH transport system substrate-binding protein